MPSRLARRLASSSAIRRSSTSRTLASASALARAERSSSVSVRSTTPELLRGAAGVPARPQSEPWPARAWRRPARARGVPAQRARHRAAALAALLDHHLLGAAMAETLAHGAGLDAWLQRQGLARHAQSLVARRFGINHSAVLISLRCARLRTVIEAVVSQNSSPHRPSCRHPPSGIGPGSGYATGRSCSPGPRAAQHVSHLTAPVPNPIVPKLKR